MYCDLWPKFFKIEQQTGLLPQLYGNCHETKFHKKCITSIVAVWCALKIITSQQIMHAAHMQVKNGDKDGEFEWELFSRIETCIDHI